jgi:hypothetical protein
METLFEKAFVKALRKHSGIKKQVENKVRMIMEQPLAMGEPLKGNFRGFYARWTGLIQDWSGWPRPMGSRFTPGVSCEGHERNKRERLCRYIARPAVASPTSIAQFHWQGGLLPEDALPGWDDPGSVRTRGFHCAISSPGTEAEGQPHPLPRRACPKSPLAWAGHTSQARQRHPVHLQHRIPHTRRTSCGNDLGPAAQARFQYRHRSLRPVRRVSQSDCLY